MVFCDFRDWYTNASCRTWYRRRKLSSAFEHPSKMVYPPGHRYTPEPSPERTYSPTKRPPPKAWENRIPSREPIDSEIGLIKNESQLVFTFSTTKILILILNSNSVIFGCLNSKIRLQISNQIKIPNSN